MPTSYPPGQTPKVYVFMDRANANALQAKHFLVGQYKTFFGKHKGEGAAGEGEGEEHHVAHKVVVTGPLAKDVVITQDYVCQIHSQRHINVHALDSGYLEAIPVKEGQAVKKGDLMFRIVPILYQAKLDAENAEARRRATGVQ